MLTINFNIDYYKVQRSDQKKIRDWHKSWDTIDKLRAKRFPLPLDPQTDWIPAADRGHSEIHIDRQRNYRLFEHDIVSITNWLKREVNSLGIHEGIDAGIVITGNSSWSKRSDIQAHGASDILKDPHIRYIHHFESIQITIDRRD